MNILRRDNLLKAFLGKSEEEKSEGSQILKAYSMLLNENRNYEIMKGKK